MLAWGWLAVAAQPAHLLCSPWSLCMHRDQENVGQWEVGPWEGEVSTAAGVTLAGPGQIQPSWARSGQPREQEPGHHCLSAPQMLNWLSACGNADGPQLMAVNVLGPTGKVTQVAYWRWHDFVTSCMYTVIILKKEKQNKNCWVLSTLVFSSLQCTSETSAKSFVTAFILFCLAKPMHESSSIQK